MWDCQKTKPDVFSLALKWRPTEGHHLCHLSEMSLILIFNKRYFCLQYYLGQTYVNYKAKFRNITSFFSRLLVNAWYKVAQYLRDCVRIQLIVSLLFLFILLQSIFSLPSFRLTCKMKQGINWITDYKVRSWFTLS